MRLARTASPLPRRSGRQESNLRSPAPEAGGVAYSPTARRSCKAPPAGLEPAASGLRARRHRPFDHGGTKPALVTACYARMELRRQGSNLPLAINSRASYRLDHAGPLLHCCLQQRKERESNPQGPQGPPVFETGYRAGGSPSEMAPAGVEPAPSRVRAGSSAVLSYGAGCDRQGSNLRRPAFQTGALPR